jgi:hypothetical protein
MNRDQKKGPAALGQAFQGGEQIKHTYKGHSVYGVIVIDHHVIGADGRPRAFGSIKDSDGNIYTGISTFTASHIGALGGYPSDDGWTSCYYAPHGTPRERTDLWLNVCRLRPKLKSQKPLPKLRARLQR